MKALIVDDEPIARQVLRETLEDFPSIQIAGEASTGPEAVEEIQRLNPDVVFLDLQLPGLDGFAILRSLRPDCIPLVIFVTAYEEHALKAFDAGAIDYLMKPVRHDRLAVAIEKAEARLAGKKTVLPSAPRRIVGRLGEELHLLDPSETIAFQADGELVVIVTARGKYFSSHSLKTLEEKLEYPRFRRIHRKTIINTDHIRTITPLTSKRWLLKMSNGLQVVVSKRLAGAIRDETRW